VVTVTKEFTVAVSPDADDAYFYNVPSDEAGTEGNVIQVDVFGSTQELVNANETVVLSIVVDGTTSDATALDGLVGIRTPDGKAVNFVASGSNFIAVIATSLSQLENFAGVMNFVIFPCFFLSSALYPIWKIKESSPFLAILTQYNPFTHAVELIRFSLYGNFNLSSFYYILFFTISCSVLSLLVYSKKNIVMR
jgi:hypothetical protein